MAIDNVLKRASATQMVTGLFGPGIRPLVAGLNQPDRQSAGWGYHGILADPPVIEVTEYVPKSNIINFGYLKGR